jgi:hypothetical protein
MVIVGETDITRATGADLFLPLETVCVGFVVIVGKTDSTSGTGAGFLLETVGVIIIVIGIGAWVVGFFVG